MRTHLREQLEKLAGSYNGSDVVRFDANETAFLERQLTYLRAKAFEVQFADNLARSFVPMATDIPADASTYAFPVWTRTGKAKVIANGAKDIPRIDLEVQEITGKVHTLGAAYGYELMELRSAARTGTDLQNMKPRAARMAIEDELDQMLAFGQTATQTSLGVTGLCNNAGVGVETNNFTVWAAGDTADALVAELNSVPAEMAETVKQAAGLLPDTLLLAPVNYNIIAQKRMGDGSDMTVLKWFLANNPYIKSVAPWHKLSTANAGGNGARAICYRRDPNVLEGVLPLDFEQLAPQADGLELVVNCIARAGGVKVYQPTAMLYLDHTN